MKKPLLSFLLVFISHYLFAQPTNNTCATAYDFGTINGGGLSHSSSLYLATQTNVTGCGNRYDVWYKFTMPAGSRAATIRVGLTSQTTSLNTGNTYIELFNTNACGSVSGNSTGCNNISATRAYSLTSGNTYLFRVNTTVNPNANANNWGYSVRITSSSNDCATATTIQPAVASYSGSVLNATASTGTPAIPAACTGTPDDDVWFKFVAAQSVATVSLNGTLTSNGSKIQVFSGPCGGPAAFVSIGCGDNIVNLTGLTPGDTYFIRIFSNAIGAPSAANSIFDISVAPLAPGTVGSGRMNEVFQQTILSVPNLLADPWEITYGPDNNLWITESKGYKVYRMNPTTGVKTTVLDISQGSTFFTAPADVAFNCQFANGSGAQGGLAGLALHPNFLNGLPSEKNYVYVSYIRTSNGGTSPTGIFFTNRLARFTYNPGTGRLESPVSLCDTLPGSGDHNSQRMIIAPDTLGGGSYLFYASGDMGAGQFGNRDRPNKAQNPLSYEGKILRFNLEPDGDAGLSAWIPNSNPYSATSAVYSIGIRNNQGFAYDTALNILYGSSHGPYSDDEINIIQRRKNYGHPLVIGYASDGNYNGTTTASTNTSLSAGAAFTDNSGNSACPPVGNESTNKTTLDANGNGLYKDPLFSAYPETNAVIRNIWQTNPGNGGWPSEGWSGLDLYTNTLIPGWKKSLVAASLKWGRLVRIKLGTSGTITVPSNDPINNAGDTISYFGSQNRFRDLAFAPNGKDIYVVMDRSTTTSGPSAANPVVPSCQGCVQKYTFLGYADNGGKSSIPTTIDVTDGTVNTCNPGTTVTIDDSNNNLWVPITGPDGNIMAEINAMGQNLGVVTSSFYKHSGPIRVKNSFHYLDRNITITPAVTSFGTPVKIRLYISKAEFDALDADPLSGITSGIGQLKILKNSDPCGPAVSSTTETINVTITGADLVHGANGYVLQGAVNGFSSFYFGTANITLPLELLTFKGSLQNNATLLQWETSNETNTSHFNVERSLDGQVFGGIGTVAASANSNASNKYSYNDYEVNNLSSTVVYYRLKMVDADGKFTYSNVVTIYLADITGLSISPNPTSGETKMMINAAADGTIQWKLRDNHGRVVMQNMTGVNKGNNNVNINISSLSSGVYYMHVTGAGIDQHVKLQKL